jgi:hypothetical protein
MTNLYQSIELGEAQINKAAAEVKNDAVTQAQQVQQGQPTAESPAEKVPASTGAGNKEMASALTNYMSQNKKSNLTHAEIMGVLNNPAKYLQSQPAPVTT